MRYSSKRQYNLIETDVHYGKKGGSSEDLSEQHSQREALEGLLWEQEIEKSVHQVPGVHLVNALHSILSTIQIVHTIAILKSISM